ncbi:hypothetical protein C8J57DRAFT_1614149 [Mycena rebaudengoi]|nr:hypothetical protein C8J57DRAFT_1614149 [Mycena rebaudengoi]
MIERCQTPGPHPSAFRTNRLPSHSATNVDTPTRHNVNWGKLEERDRAVRAWREGQRKRTREDKKQARRKAEEYNLRKMKEAEDNRRRKEKQAADALARCQEERRRKAQREDPARVWCAKQKELERNQALRKAEEDRLRKVQEAEKRRRKEKQAAEELARDRKRRQKEAENRKREKQAAEELQRERERREKAVRNWCAQQRKEAKWTPEEDWGRAPDSHAHRERTRKEEKNRGSMNIEPDEEMEGWANIQDIPECEDANNITADKVVAFCDRSTWENMGKTDKEIDLILKRIAYRFHPDRFNRGRAVVRTIPSSSERELVVEAADIVIKSVNNCRRGDR